MLMRVPAGPVSADWLKMLWRRVSRDILAMSFGLGSSLCAFGVGTWPRAERGRVAWICASDSVSGIGVDALEDLRGKLGISDRLAVFGATDSLRGRDEAAVTVGCTEGSEISCEKPGVIGDDREGVAC